MHSKIYVLKITLEEIEPAIWRRFIVPDDIPLDRLHDIIQVVMGWQDSHLHEFEINGKRYQDTPDPDMDNDAIACLDGERACPPEDVGGTHGYDEFCKILSDKKHPQHDEFKTWCGGVFDSELFDRNKIDMGLLTYLRWSRPRIIEWDV